MIVFQSDANGMPHLVDYDTGEVLGYCEQWEIEFGMFDIAKMKLCLVIQNYHGGGFQQKFRQPRLEDRRPIQATAELHNKPKQLPPTCRMPIDCEDDNV